MERTQPICGTIASASHLIPKPEEEPKPDGSSSEGTSTEPAPSQRTSRSNLSRAEEDLLPNMICAPGTEIRWTEWPSRTYPVGSTPQEISRHSLDTSYQLESLAGTDPSGYFIFEIFPFFSTCFFSPTEVLKTQMSV